MALETASYIANLVVGNPDGGDAPSTLDNHIRLLKAVLQRTFPKMDGAVSLSSAQVMYLNDVSASVQLQLNQLRDGSATANAAINSRYANSASFATLANTANSASFAVRAGHAQSASFATNAGFAQSASYAAFAGLATNATNAANATNADVAATATTAATATFANTATSASSAALLAGQSGATAATANTVAVRNSAGDLFARYFNTGASVETPSVGHVAVMTNGDGYWRITTVAQLGVYLQARNITGRTGTAKTLASGSGPPSLSGSTNGDIWFFY